MRQCLACPLQFTDELTLCPACNSTRHVRLAGGGGASDTGVVGALRQAVATILWDKDWTPNGIRWAGAAMVLLEAPALLLLPNIDGIAFLLIIPWMIMISGALIWFSAGGEWSEWLGRIFCGFELMRAARALIMGALFSGSLAESLAVLEYCVVLVSILMLLAQGYAHPKSPRWIRLILPLLLINLVLGAVAWATTEAEPEFDEAEVTAPARPGADRGGAAGQPTPNNSPFDLIPEDAGEPPPAPSFDP
ncbi:MAG: hypothetical protein H0W72_07135 [Planctomycetes bacterium]|nr:hypothetical protein [Planctomycetota bacterium]